jgi:hypothetical protein
LPLLLERRIITPFFRLTEAETKPRAHEERKPSMRLTKRLSRTPPPLTKTRELVYGRRGLGLGLPSATGRNGPPRKLKIGDASRMSLDEAREEAWRLLAMMNRGEDPIASVKTIAKHRRWPISLSATSSTR